MSAVTAGVFFLAVAVVIVMAVLLGSRFVEAHQRFKLAVLLRWPVRQYRVSDILRGSVSLIISMLAAGYLAVVSGALWLRMNPENPVLPADSGAVRYQSAFPVVDVPGSGELSALFRGDSRGWQNIDWDTAGIRFSDGKVGSPVRMMHIHLQEGWDSEGETFRLSITPAHLNAPVIELLSFDPASGGAPDIAVIKGGYWLELEVAEAHESVLRGRIRLVLPKAYQTWLVGDFVASPNGIRYVHGELDRTHDTPQTLARIGASHANSLLWRWIEGAPQVSRVSLQTSFEPMSGQGMVRVNLGNLGDFDLPLAFAKGESGWYVVPDSVPLLAATLEMQSFPSAAGNAKPSMAVPAAKASSVSSPEPATIERFGVLHRNIGLQGNLYTLDGRRIAGAIAGVEGNQLRLQRVVEGNALVVAVSESNFLKFVPLR